MKVDVNSYLTETEINYKKYWPKAVFAPDDVTPIGLVVACGDSLGDLRRTYKVLCRRGNGLLKELSGFFHECPSCSCLEVPDPQTMSNWWECENLWDGDPTGQISLQYPPSLVLVSKEVLQ